MSQLNLVAFMGLAIAAFAMLLVTQTKERVSWPAWLVPIGFVAALVVWTGFAIFREGPTGFWRIHTESLWGIQTWYDRLMSVTAAFYLLQNRARAVGMKSEVWVLFVIFTGSVGLLLMLARTLYCEREQQAASERARAAQAAGGRRAGT